MLERLENLSALYANPHRFMKLAARLHARLAVAMGVLAQPVHGGGVWRLPTRGNGTHYVCTCRQRGWLFLLTASYFLPALAVVAPSIGLSGSPRGCPVGAVFTLVALVTGAFWGQPMWGTWWVWDAGFCLVLLFIYLGYIALWKRLMIMVARRATSVWLSRVCECADCKIFGRLVEHPAPAGQRVAFCAARLHADFLYPLLVMGVAFLFLFLAITLTRLQMKFCASACVCARARLKEVGLGPGNV